MIKVGGASGYASGVNYSCFPQVRADAMPIIPSVGNFSHLTKTKLCFQRNQASKVNECSLAAVQTTSALSQITIEEHPLVGDVQDGSGHGVSEEEIEIDPREAQRRMRISKANKGKVPWNKGRKHSPVTLARIKERTKQAMQDPKLRLKLVEAQRLRAASEMENRKEELRVIREAGNRAYWNKRRLMQTCIIEWKESIAESARKGGDGEYELQWDSYYTLKEDIHQEWLQAIAADKSIQKEVGCSRPGIPLTAEQRRKLAESMKAKWTDPEYREKVTKGVAGCSRLRASKSTEHRQKISESIKAKWADPEYRKNVKIGWEKKEKSNHLMEYRKNVKIGWEKKEKSNHLMVRKTRVGMEIDSRPSKHQLQENFDYKIPSIHERKVKPQYYSDQHVEAKLQKLKIIRAQRAALELDQKEAKDLKKKEAVEHTMLLISEAVKAAKALEHAATFNPSLRTHLSEMYGLIDEAIHTIQSAESGGSTNTSVNRLTCKATLSVDKLEVADAAIASSDDNHGVHQTSVTKSRQKYENTRLASESETCLGCEITRSLYHDSYESSHPISSPKIGSSEVATSTISFAGSEMQRSGLVNEETNSIGQIAPLIGKQDNQGNPD